MLYVLDEPSIGLHPSNIVGLNGVMHDLIADGNSVVLVDHDTQVLAESDYIIEMGPEAGAGGGRIIAQGTVPELTANAASQIGPFLGGQGSVTPQNRPAEELFAEGRIHLSTGAIHTVKPLEVDIPKGRLTVVTGVSGSGKTTLILESLVPALAAKTSGAALPAHVKDVQAVGIGQVKLIDATPIGINVRSTVATYANVHDELRKVFARTPDAKRLGYKAGDFSYNTGKLRCPVCDGTGTISLDVQFLPDVEIPCTACRGSRYAPEADAVHHENKHSGAYTLPELMDMDINTALTACTDLKLVTQRLKVLQDLGLGYLTLGEETPSLSGGEAQRLKLASEMGKAQGDTVFVFDEPTMAAKETLAVGQKRSIAQAAADLVRAGDFVYIDAGSTTLAMVRALSGPALDAHYVTNGIAHARLLAQKSCNVCVPGGLLRPKTEAIIGAAALTSLQQFNFTKAFLGANGVALGAGFTTPDPEEAAVKAMASRRARETWFLVDDSKFGRVYPAVISELYGGAILTNRCPEPKYNQLTLVKETEL